MIQQNFSEAAVKIRKATAEDTEAIADLYFRSYYNRFFDEGAAGRDGKAYGAPLAKEFPELAAGQNRQWFADYCRDFIPTTLGEQDGPQNACFVAEVVEQGQKKIIGFIKGNTGPTDQDMYGTVKSQNTNTNPIPPREKWGELGSVYIDPDVQTAGIGRQLTQKWAQLLGQNGIEAMVTRCYAGNDSPFFFAKLGAESWTDCTIPNGYYATDESGATVTKSVDIPGFCMVWEPDQFAALTRYDNVGYIPKGETVTGRKFSDINVPLPKTPGTPDTGQSTPAAFNDNAAVEINVPERTKPRQLGRWGLGRHGM